MGELKLAAGVARKHRVAAPRAEAESEVPGMRGGVMSCRSEGFTAVKREFEDKRAVHISDRHPLLGHIRVSGASLPCV